MSKSELHTSNTGLEQYRLITAKELGRILSLSTRSIWRLRAAGKLPRPVKVGGAIRWMLADINKWASWGCPPQKDFEALVD
jgi:prophage regulatory protein